MPNPFCRKFRALLFLDVRKVYCICSILGGLGWNCRGLKILPGGRGLFGARTLQKMPGEKVPGSIPARARPAYLADFDDSENDGHEEDYKEDEDDEVENGDDER